VEEQPLWPHKMKRSLVKERPFTATRKDQEKERFLAAAGSR
jgi:hypothetical protein